MPVDHKRKTTTRTAPRPCGLDRSPSDPYWQAVELAQRGRMVLDVTAADLKAAEEAYGPFHPTAWHFRTAWHEAMRSWDCLRARVGGATLEAALEEPPRVVLALGPGAPGYTPDPSGRWPLPQPQPPGPGSAPPAPVLLVPIAGKTYQVLRAAGGPLAPRIWRLTRMNPPLDDGPYYACRLHDHSTQCDCAEWAYGPDAAHPRPLCKHLAALASLGWL